MTVVGAINIDGWAGADEDNDLRTYWAQLPARAPVPMTEANVNVSSDVGSGCTGSFGGPTAPAGKVCVYPIFFPPTLGFGVDTIGAGELNGTGPSLASPTLFEVRYSINNGGTAGPVNFAASWAYTAPSLP